MERYSSRVVAWTTYGQGTCHKASCSSVFKVFFNTLKHWLKDLFKEKHKYKSSTKLNRIKLWDKVIETLSISTVGLSRELEAKERANKEPDRGSNLEEGIGVREARVMAVAALLAIGLSTASLPGRDFRGGRE
jgi:hypothetical protein